MASTVTELMMRRMGAKSGSAIDWESIAKGMLDGVSTFDITSNVSVNYSIGYLFMNRKGLASCAVSEGTTGLSLSCFNGCTNLASVELPSTLTKIGQTALMATKIGSITIPSQVTSIGVMAFSNCSSLTEVIMQPTAPPTLGTSAFNACNALTTIYVPDASVDTYKGASGWSSFSNKIKPISQRPT